MTTLITFVRTWGPLAVLVLLTALAAAAVVIASVAHAVAGWNPAKATKLQHVAAVLSAVYHGLEGIALKWPGTMPYPTAPASPSASAPPPPSSGPSASGGAGLVALLVVVFLGSAGCGSMQLPVALQRAERDAIGCGAAAAQAQMQALAPSIINALAGNDARWEDQLTALEANAGGAVTCAVAHLVWDALGNGAKNLPALDELVRRADLRAATAKAIGEVTELPPSTLMLHRGARWLFLRLASRRPYVPAPPWRELKPTAAPNEGTR